MTAAILYLHIFIVYLMHRYDVLQHYSATIHFLQAEAMPLIFIFFIIAFLTNLMLFISRFVGVKFTLNLVTNRYQQAKYENLVLMYLDLNDSTRLTEKLGNETFFEFEQEFFKDLAEATYQTRGDLEEYVGDEAVITWPLALGVKNQHCIRLFYLFKEKLAARQAFYLQRFGEMPTFKASLHSGEVLRGVVGINKIVVTRRGQVMNIGARILAECHNLKQNLLISQTLKDQLPTSNDYRFISLGSHNFKGSSDSLAIYGIQPVEKC
jgi:adenylate cyclase